MHKINILVIGILLLTGCGDKSKNPRIYYYNDKKVRAIKYFKDSLLNGECFWYYPNGKLREKVEYKNGKVNGHAYFFYESGALKSHRFFHENKNIGYMADYFNDTMGIVKNVLLFNNAGKLIYLKEFDRNGNIIKESGNKPD